ncbi:MAG: hypothetical protein C0605_09120 [Hyphomicrobiales bacterium]|nr:MAG: hypothetical protein C0605_09120 [Hyphomicrobiales bacterium]
MFDRIIILNVLMATALTALIGGCQNMGTGYPIIGHIKQPRSDFLTPAQQQAEARRLEAAKAANLARARRAVR